MNGATKPQPVQLRRCGRGFSLERGAARCAEAVDDDALDDDALDDDAVDDDAVDDEAVDDIVIELSVRRNHVHVNTTGAMLACSRNHASRLWHTVPNQT